MQILFLKVLARKGCDVITWAGLSMRTVLLCAVQNSYEGKVRITCQRESHLFCSCAGALVIDQVDSDGRGMTMMTPFNPLNTKQLQALDVQWNIHRPLQPHGWLFVFSFSLVTLQSKRAVVLRYLRPELKLCYS